MPEEKKKKITGEEVSEESIKNAFKKEEQVKSPGLDTGEHLKPKKKEKRRILSTLDSKSILNLDFVEEKRKEPQKKREQVDQKTVLEMNQSFSQEEKKEKKKPSEKIDPKSILDFEGDYQADVQEQEAKKKRDLLDFFSKKNNTKNEIPLQSLPERAPIQLSFSEKRGEDLSSESFSSIGQTLHIVASVLVASFFLGVNFFLGGSAKEEAWVPKNEIRTTKSEIALSSGENFIIRDRTALFGGEEIVAGDEGAEIRFFDGSVARLESEASLKILALRPSPNIEVVSGKVWFFGQEDPKITIQNASFSGRSASFLVESSLEKIRIASFRHSVFGEIWSENNPTKSTVVIPVNQEITLFRSGIPDTHDEIRFSKLKKEIHFAKAKTDDWVIQNLRFDRQELISSVRKIRPQNIKLSRADGLFAKMTANFVFFDTKKEMIQEANQENIQKAFWEEYIFGGQSLGILPQDVVDETLEKALFMASMLEPDSRLLQKVSEINSEILSRNTDQKSRLLVSNTGFALLENALSSGNIEASEKIVASINDFWKKSAALPENKKMLDIDREILATLLQKNKNQTSGNLFLAMADLDALAVKWETESPSVIALETATKNFDIIDALLQKADFAAAKKLLEINNRYLEMEPEKNLLAAYSNGQEKQDYLTEKFGIFREKGVMSEESLHAFLKSRSDAEIAIKRLEEEQQRLLERLMNQDSEMTTEEKVREDFSENEIAIVSLILPQDKDEDWVKIAEGILPNKNTFSAQYLPREKVLKEILISDEDIDIAREVPLASFLLVLENIRNNKTSPVVTLDDIVDQSGDDWSETLENPLKDVDPVEISVNKHLLQKEVSKNGMSVELRNVVMIDKNTLVVSAVKYSDDGRRTVSFSYDLLSGSVFNIVLDQESRKISQKVMLEDLRQVLQEEQEIIEEEKEFIKKVEWEMRRSGVDIGEEDFSLRDETLAFSNGLLGEKIISGIIDSNAEVFLFVRDKDGILFQDIPLEDLYLEIESLAPNENPL